MKLLMRASRRYLDSHRWQFGLSIVGVALGVAVVVSVDLANAGAARAFEISSDTVTGRTTHQIVGGPSGVPEELFATLRTDVGLRRVAPLIEGFVSLAEDREAEGFTVRRPLRLLGVDPFSEAPFRSQLGTGPLQLDLGQFLTVPDAVVMSRGTADSLGVALGDRLEVRVGRERRQLTVAGILTPASANDAEAAADLLVCDIATAQEILDLRGRITRLDVIFDETPAGAELQQAVREALPADVQLVDAAARTATTLGLTRAFRLNLTALSMLALVCGVFLVYNTMSFSVVQRRGMIGSMRALGVTRGEVFRLIVGEALAVGALGTALGLVGGIAIGRLLVGLVLQTVNDLYFVLAIRELSLDPWSMLKGAALGIFGATLASVPAALEATNAPPRAVLMRSQVEARARRRARPAALAGIVLLAAAGALLFVSGRDLVVSFAALFLALLGFALLTPASVVLCMRAAAAPMAALLGPLGGIATRGVAASLSRTAVAIAALMIAISVVIGVGVMIDSFRGTVTRWLGAVLVADLYVAPLSPGAVPVTFALDDGTADRLRDIDGIEQMSTVLGVELPTAAGGRTRLIVFDIDDRGEAGFQFTSGDAEDIWAAFRGGDNAIVTEPYAYRHEVAVGSVISLPTDFGARDFTVVGIYYNYASEEGLVALDRRVYDQYWAAGAISGFSVYLNEGASRASVENEIRRALGEREVMIQSNRALRQISLEVFDRTFLITGVLRFLVTLVAFIGVLSALMSLQLERAREVGILRALGLTPREVWRLSVAQSGLMGAVSGLLAIPVGLCLAAIMTFVINRRSFGWTLQMQADPSILALAFLLALVASLAAGLYPALRVSTTPAATALREE